MSGTPDRMRSGALRRLTEIATSGPRLAWNAPSRFGGAGMLGRRFLQRVLRPYAVRQHELDVALLEAIQELSDRMDAATRDDRVRRDLAPVSSWPAAPLPDDLEEVETDVGRLWLDATDGLITPLIREHRSWEPDVAAFVRRRLRPGGTFVDVGANIGYFSVLASQIVASEGRVFAVEPEPRTRAILTANLWRNGCANVVVVPLAAAAHTGYLSLLLNPDGLAGSWVEDAPGESTISVPCARLDDLLCGRTVDLLKIDVERSEHRVIRGTEETLRRSPDVSAVVEFWPGLPEVYGERPGEILDYYERLGFEVCLLGADGSAIPAPRADIFAAAGAAPLMNVVLRKHR